MVAKAVYTGGRFTLELDDKKAVGFINSIDGGHFKSDVATSVLGGRPGQSGGDFLVHKFAGRPKYEDITLTTGTALSPSFWKWVKGTIDNKPERRNGALVNYDYDNKEQLRRTFSRALISEITFPAVDAAAKGGSQLSVKIVPELLEYLDGDGSSLKIDEPAGGLAKQKRWTQSSFRMSIDKFGTDGALGHCKVEAITIKQNVVRNPVGPELNPRVEVGKVELPNLVLTFPESHVKPWMEWFNSSIVLGKRGTTTGSLVYLSPDGKDELAKLNFFGLGIVSIDLDKLEAMKESVQRVKVTLFMEGLTVEGGKGTT